jgi:hypothetical protein
VANVADNSKMDSSFSDNCSCKERHVSSSDIVVLVLVVVVSFIVVIIIVVKTRWMMLGGEGECDSACEYVPA